MSIRLRLTLLYSAILALTLMIFSAVLYAAQSQYTLSVGRCHFPGWSKEKVLKGKGRAMFCSPWSKNAVPAI
jgi:hypothetical protein